MCHFDGIRFWTIDIGTSTRSSFWYILKEWNSAYPGMMTFKAHTHSRPPKWIAIDPITKTYLYNFDPLKPHFYIVKLGFTGVHIIFLFLLKNIDCGYSLEPPRRGGSNEYPQYMFWAELWKISEFLSENFQFFCGEIFNIFSIYLNMRVFVMQYMYKDALHVNRDKTLQL